jgi:hypothetical protein
MGKRYENPTVIEKGQLDQLESTYLLRDVSIVRQFLKNNPELLPLLEDVRPHVTKYFGEPAQMSLEVITDPELR